MAINTSLNNIQDRKPLDKQQIGSITTDGAADVSSTLSSAANSAQATQTLALASSANFSNGDVCVVPGGGIGGTIPAFLQIQQISGNTVAVGAYSLVTNVASGVTITRSNAIPVRGMPRSFVLIDRTNGTRYEWTESMDMSVRVTSGTGAYSLLANAVLMTPNYINLLPGVLSTSAVLTYDVVINY